MSTAMPIVQQPPSAVQQVTQQPYAAHGSVGPVIVVLAVITVLGVLARMVGRLCSGRRVIGHHYDLETWIETKCSSCVDGTIAVPPQPRPPPADDNSAADAPPETEEEEESGRSRRGTINRKGSCVEERSFDYIEMMRGWNGGEVTEAIDTGITRHKGKRAPRKGERVKEKRGSYGGVLGENTEKMER